ncbi:hypothetical protein MKW98_021211, partial [Papaver atlanticum]
MPPCIDNKHEPTSSGVASYLGISINHTIISLRKASLLHWKRRKLHRFRLHMWVYGQIWITLARFQTARSKHRILDKRIEFEQVDRERN